MYFRKHGYSCFAKGGGELTCSIYSFTHTFDHSSNFVY